MMGTVEFKLVLPDQLGREAEALGLLKPATLERLLREEIRRCQVEQLFDAADRLAALAEAPLTAAEIEAEIESVRTERRGSRARGA
jgi:hypothetical protein